MTAAESDRSRHRSLEEERTFLLASIQDLNAERAVDDIDPTHYNQLLDDYTRRAANVIRALDSNSLANEPPTRASRRQVLFWLVGLTLLGALSGVLIARSSGARTSVDTFTGGVRESQVTRLNRAQGLLADQTQWDNAIEIFEDVLDDDPSNTEALTYRAWLQYRQGEQPDVVLQDLTEATRLDPMYADPIVFTAIILADDRRYDEAADALNTLNVDTAPPPIIEFLEVRGLTGEVYGEATYDKLVTATVEPTLDSLDLTPESALAAADYLLSSGKEEAVVAALKLYEAVEEFEPNNPEALSRRARLLAATGEADLLVRARAMVDQALTTHPAHPEALIMRALILLLAGDTNAACDDLNTFNQIDNVPPQLAAEAETLTEQSCN